MENLPAARLCDRNQLGEAEDSRAFPFSFPCHDENVSIGQFAQDTVGTLLGDFRFHDEICGLEDRARKKRIDRLDCVLRMCYFGDKLFHRFVQFDNCRCLLVVLGRLLDKGL